MMLQMQKINISNETVDFYAFAIEDLKIHVIYKSI